MRADPAAPARRRRLRDRLVDREGTENHRLAAEPRLTNHLMLVDDELRETALALTGIEAYLAQALLVLEREDLRPGDLEALAADLEVEARVVELDETLASLKRRLRVMAAQIR